MTDMLQTIIPKSDQMNFDDFAANQTKTIKITKVSGISGDQPIAINYEGDNGKPYKPCKSMRRILVHCWGANGHDYVGRSMTLYGDPEVKFGGLAVGGIRISHLSDIKSTVTLALTATKASRKPFTVHPLKESPVPEPIAPDPAIELVKKNMRAAAEKGVKELTERWQELNPQYQNAIQDIKQECWKIAKEVDEKK